MWVCVGVGVYALITFHFDLNGYSRYIKARVHLVSYYIIILPKQVTKYNAILYLLCQVTSANDEINRDRLCSDGDLFRKGQK